ncbi:MAG: DUF262 domain-containing protein [Spirochaetaceae bacterium]|jgi:uncharacterized protein with ParB-like and HNH nuclease domain|nr:DUF262 domain-containing protein [Spirochaetaceae bacterium]
MKIELHQIPIRELVAGYINSDEEGVKGYGGKLDIRPKYQREFVYKDEQRNAVIDTVRNGFPLNVMYWVENPDGSYEVLDGQQRTISICEFVNGRFSIGYKQFSTLADDEQELRNAVYTGAWLIDAKKYFSKTNCAAIGIAKNYVNGSPIRQEYLETALDWI